MMQKTKNNKPLRITTNQVKLKTVLSDLVDLRSLLEDRIVELRDNKATQPHVHAFLFYRSLVYRALISLTGDKFYNE